jgi:putative ABC transport system substrate-binding protein
MRRRDLIKAITGSAALWPLVVRAQPAAAPVVGCLMNQSPGETEIFLPHFRQGLSETGYVEGQNLRIEYRWAAGQNDRLPELAADLINLRVAVIAAFPSASAPLAAKRLTTTIPIVFEIGGDPVELGLVASLNKPGANLTGASSAAGLLVTKQLGLLGELVPKPATFALLTNPRSPNTKRLIANTQAAAQALGRELHIVSADSEKELATAFMSLVDHRDGGLIVPSSALFQVDREQIVALAERHRIPAVYFGRDYADMGGLMSYGPSRKELLRQVGIYTGRILRGAKPADLPVIQATKFELVINLKTAKTLGLDVPTSMQLLADEVIE